MNVRKAGPAPFLTAFLCSSFSAIGAVFCVVTAFHVPVDGWQLALGIFLLSALFAYVCGCRRGWIALLALALAAAAAGYYFRLALYASASVTLESISSVYASAFESLQTVSLMHTDPDATGTVFLTVLGAVLSLITAWTVRGQNTPWLAVVCSVLPLVACLIILQSVPAAWAVLMLIGAIALLLLTQQMRRHSARAGGVLAMALLLPLSVLMLILYAIFPQADYTRSEWSESLRPMVNQVADQLAVFRLNETTGQVQLVSPFTPSTLGGRVWDSSVKKANLNRVGPQRMSGQHVMRIYASGGGGAYYLRGCSMGVYEDNEWRAVSDEDYADAPIPKDIFLISGNYGEEQVQIETDMKSSIYYMPYLLTELPENAEPIYDAYLKNPLQQTQYAVNRAFGDLQVSNNAAGDGYRDFVYETYTQIPDALRTALSSPAILPVRSYRPTDVSEILELVRQIVQDGKTYDLNTPRVPEGEDFVTWFLTESTTGYCVHFATAATMLLRYCGVPARYVTGYLVNAEAGVWKDVTQDDAHAWVEYYRDDFGWLAFDPTPAAAQPGADEPTGEQQPDPQPDPEKKPDVSENENPEQSDEEMNHTTEHPDKNRDDSNDFNAPAGSQETDQKTSAGWLWTAIWCLLGIAAVIFGWRIAVLTARTARFARGSTNRRAVQYYRHITLLSRLGKTEPPDELEQLAQKARFSQHRLTEKELQLFEEYADTVTRQLLQEAKPARRTVYRLLYVLQEPK